MQKTNSRKVFADNLQMYLKKNKKTQADLVRDLNFNKSTVSAWLTEQKYPRIDKMQQLADYFGIYKSDLTEEKNGIQSSFRSVKIPVLKRISADHSAEKIASDTIGYEEIEYQLAVSGEICALQISEDAMEPRFFKGDLIIIKQQSAFESGQFVLVSINDNDAILRKILVNESGVTLLPFNNHYDPLFFSNDEIKAKTVEIIGKVIELRTKF